MKQKEKSSTKFAYCIITTNITKIAYGILTKTTDFAPDYESSIYPSQNEDIENFSVSDCKMLQRARHPLKRLSKIDEIGVICSFSKGLEFQLDFTSQGFFSNSSFNFFMNTN